ncbi:hypothetical protein ACSBR1_015868 [Camellia fascicularis]
MLEGDGRDKCMPLGEEKIFDPSVRNLSNLNLGGEISPAIGDLKNLQSMYAFFANPVDLVFLLIVTRLT